jgi:hypothetical protein
MRNWKNLKQRKSLPETIVFEDIENELDLSRESVESRGSVASLRYDGTERDVSRGLYPMPIPENIVQQLKWYTIVGK